MAKGKTVHVTSAQKQAAQALVARGAKAGRSVSLSVSKIANAETRSAEGAGGSKLSS